MIGTNTKLKLTLEVSDNEGHRKYVSEYCGDPEMAQHENNLISQAVCEFMTYGNLDFGPSILCGLYGEIKRECIAKENGRMDYNSDGKCTGGVYVRREKK